MDARLLLALGLCLGQDFPADESPFGVRDLSGPVKVPLEPLQDAEWPMLNEVSPKTAKQVEQLAKDLDWRGLLDQYDLAHEKHASKLVRDPREPRRLLGFAEWMRAKIQSLHGAEEAFRDRYDGTAAAAFRAATEAGDWNALEEAAERYFLASGFREALDLVAHRRFAAGDIASAAMAWQKLLDRLGGDDALVACRLATAYVLLGDTEGLTRVQALPLTGRVLIGGRPRQVEDYLGSLTVEGRPRTAAPEPEWSPSAHRRARPFGTACEVGLGTGTLRFDAGGKYTGPLDLRGLVVRRDGRDLVVFHTGRRLVAVDPARGDGRSLERAIYWRWPEDDPIRGDNSIAFQYGTVFAAAAEGDRLVATMLGDAPPPTVPRRIPYDGATRVVALDLRTGRELWDTAKLRTVHRGRTVPVLEPLPFGDREYAFTSPPAIANGRIYLAVTTHPAADRDTHVLCLDLATGKPLWCTPAAAGQPNLPPTMPTLFADRRGVFVATNVGAVLALDPESGRPRWGSTYPQVSSSRQRQASPPVLSGARLFVLPQDAAEMLAFDALTGRRLPLTWANRPNSRLEWSRIGAVTEVAPGLLIATGEELWMLNLQDMRWNTLTGDIASWGQSPPALLRDALYVPYATGDVRGIAVYERDSWKYQGRFPLSKGQGIAHFVFGLDYVAVQGRDFRILTATSAVEAAYAARSDADPPVPEACLRLAGILRESGRWLRAVSAYERFFLAAEGDPRWRAEVEDARRWIAEVRRKN